MNDIMVNKINLKLKEFIEKIKASENPIIIFDDDADGVSSFLLLSKIFDHLNKDYKFRIVKSKPLLNSKYTHYLYGHDMAFVLDKPGFKKDFIDNVDIPIVWIDHHEPFEVPNNMFYFNPRCYDDSDNRATTYWIHRTMKIYDDINDTNLYDEYKWIASIGIIGDWFIPDFLDELKERYSGYYEGNDQLSLLFDSKIGKVIQKVSFMLKGRTSVIKRRLDKLLEFESLKELDESESFSEINEKIDEFEELLKLAKKRFDNQKGKVKYFIYERKESYTSYLSNNLMYFYPDSVIFVCRNTKGDLKCSVRSNEYSLPERLDDAMQNIDGTSGGHEHACGMFISKDDFPVFLNRFETSL